MGNRQETRTRTRARVRARPRTGPPWTTVRAAALLLVGGLFFQMCDAFPLRAPGGARGHTSSLLPSYPPTLLSPTLLPSYLLPTSP